MAICLTLAGQALGQTSSAATSAGPPVLHLSKTATIKVPPTEAGFLDWAATAKDVAPASAQTHVNDNLSRAKTLAAATLPNATPSPKEVPAEVSADVALRPVNRHRRSIHAATLPPGETSLFAKLDDIPRTDIDANLRAVLAAGRQPHRTGLRGGSSALRPNEAGSAGVFLLSGCETLCHADGPQTARRRQGAPAGTCKRLETYDHDTDSAILLVGRRRTGTWRARSWVARAASFNGDWHPLPSSQP